MSPQRIQLRRVKGWRKPEGAVVVARPTKWGNPFRAINPTGDIDGWYVTDGAEQCWASDRWTALACAYTDFKTGVTNGTINGYPTCDEIRRELAGRDLCCWCPPGQICHADVLLEIANGGTR